MVLLMKNSPLGIKEKMNTEEKLKSEINQVFGNLTGEQLWAIVKLAKNVRLRCRNNKAFNNFMNRMFPYAKFEQVIKSKQDGTKYPGLSISVNGSSVEAEDEEG